VKTNTAEVRCAFLPRAEWLVVVPILLLLLTA
jgi:hypothetical protein